MDDLISRQAAIEELRRIMIVLYGYDSTSIISCAIYKLQNLPPAEPNRKMDDLISRQAAIDAIDTGLWGVEWDKALATAMLKDLPSAQQKSLKYLGDDRICIYCENCDCAGCVYDHD